MAQFDVHRNPRGGAFPLLLDIQADVVARLATRVVVPLARRKGYGAQPLTRLNPIVTMNGVEYVLVFQELAGIPASALGARVGSMAARRAELIAALDWLITGT
jgi:toxin CcdB